MNPFSSLLKDIHSKLDVPQPAKSRILLEIAADMDDLFRAYISQGKPESEAIRLTEEMFSLDDGAISELINIHQPPFRKWIDKLSAQTQSKLEKSWLTAALMILILLAGHSISSQQFFRSASGFIYPILAIGLGSLMIAAVKFYTLFIKKDHSPKTLHSGMTPLLVLGAVNFFVGAWGYLIEIYTHGGGVALPAGSLISLIVIVNPPQEQLLSLADCFIRSASVVLSALFVASLNAILCFGLINKIVQIEKMEAEHLLK